MRMGLSGSVPTIRAPKLSMTRYLGTPPKRANAAFKPAITYSSIWRCVGHTKQWREYDSTLISAHTTVSLPVAGSVIIPIRPKSATTASPGSVSAIRTVRKLRRPQLHLQIGEIAQLLVEQVQGRLLERGMTSDLTEAARDLLVAEGFGVTYGGRPLRRAVQRHLENQLSRGVLSGEFNEGDHFIAGMNPAGDDLCLKAGGFASAEPEVELTGAE